MNASVKTTTRLEDLINNRDAENAMVQGIVLTEGQSKELQSLINNTSDWIDLTFVNKLGADDAMEQPLIRYKDDRDLEDNVPERHDDEEILFNEGDFYGRV